MTKFLINRTFYSRIALQPAQKVLYCGEHSAERNRDFPMPGCTRLAFPIKTLSLSLLIFLNLVPLALAQSASPPRFSRPGGTFAQAFQLTLTPAAVGDEIHYTINGTKPSAASTLYTGPLTINTSVMVRACAVRAGVTQSQTASEGYLALGSDIAHF